jgi:hypothetical protein
MKRKAVSLTPNDKRSKDIETKRELAVTFPEESTPTDLICVRINKDSKLLQCGIIRKLYEIEKATPAHRFSDDDLTVQFTSSQKWFDAYCANKYPTYRSNWADLISFLLMLDHLEDEKTFQTLVLQELEDRFTLELADASESLIYELITVSRPTLVCRPHPLVNVLLVKEIIEYAYKWNRFPFLWQALDLLMQLPRLPIAEIFQSLPSDLHALEFRHRVESSRQDIPPSQFFFPGMILTASREPHDLSWSRGDTLGVVGMIRTDQDFEILYPSEWEEDWKVSHMFFAEHFQTISRRSISHLGRYEDEWITKLEPGFFRAFIEKYVLQRVK